MGYKGSFLIRIPIRIVEAHRQPFHSIPNKFVYLHIKGRYPTSLENYYFSLTDGLVKKMFPNSLWGHCGDKNKSAQDLNSVKWLPADLTLIANLQKELI